MVNDDFVFSYGRANTHENWTREHINRNRYFHRNLSFRNWDNPHIHPHHPPPLLYLTATLSTTDKIFKLWSHSYRNHGIQVDVKHKPPSKRWRKEMTCVQTGFGSNLFHHLTSVHGFAQTLVQAFGRIAVGNDGIKIRHVPKTIGLWPPCLFVAKSLWIVLKVQLARYLSAAVQTKNLVKPGRWVCLVRRLSDFLGVPGVLLMTEKYVCGNESCSG